MPIRVLTNEERDIAIPIPRQRPALCHGQAFSDTQLRYFRQLPVHSPQGFGSPVRSAICVCCRS